MDAERLDAMDYLGEARVSLQELQMVAAAGGAATTRRGLTACT